MGRKISDEFMFSLIISVFIEYDNVYKISHFRKNCFHYNIFEEYHFQELFDLQVRLHRVRVRRCRQPIFIRGSRRALPLPRSSLRPRHRSPDPKPVQEKSGQTRRTRRRTVR